MNVASLELCKELYELSGWDDTQSWYVQDDVDESHWELWPEIPPFDEDFLKQCPAYDLGYLLRKLPRHLELRRQMWHLLVMNGDVAETNWIADYVTTGRECWLHDGGRAQLTETDTPEDAAAKLAIELFKQNILTKEQ